MALTAKIFALLSGIAFFSASASQPATAVPVLVGSIHAVSQSDIRAALAAPYLPQTVRFIRVVDHNTIQLHYESRGDRCEHYDDIRRKQGKWVYKTTVVVVEGCGYIKA